MRWLRISRISVPYIGHTVAKG